MTRDRAQHVDDITHCATQQSKERNATVTNRQALEKILNYLEHAEYKHFQDCSKKQRRNHIYEAARQVRVWLESDFGLAGTPDFIPLAASHESSPEFKRLED